MKAVRDPLAREVLAPPAAALSVSSLRGHHYLLLVTSRRDGSRVATPMWFAPDGGRRLLLRSGASDPKLDRIRRDRRVIVTACNARGKALGPPMRARARILPREEEAKAELVMKRALGWKRDLYTLLRAPLLPMTYIEVAPDDTQPIIRRRKNPTCRVSPHGSACRPPGNCHASGAPGRPDDP